jgi:protein kinase-like protein
MKAKGRTRTTRRRSAKKPAAAARHGSRGAKAIGKYRIGGPLGHGGMGTVYKALDTTLDRDVAIKVLHRDRADARMIDRFQAEATTLARLNHPEIATVYELFRSRHDLLLVMELVRGETLESICGRVPLLPPQAAASLADKMLSALDHAHAVGIVHCDVKPANVMVTESGGIKMMDFGTARVGGAAAATADGFTVGTPAYMSPEQFRGDDVDGRSDVYSVGVVLYRLLTGTLPFDGDTALAVAQQHVAQPAPPVHTRRDGLPEWCEAILQRALAKSPGDRFQTACEFREALRRATGMTAAELGQPCAIPLHVCDTPAEMRQPMRPRTTTPRRGRRAGSTLVLNDAGRTASMFRVAVRRRRRHTVPTSRRALALGSLAAVLIVGAAAATIAPLRRPSAVAPAVSAPVVAPVVLRARAVTASRTRPRDTMCRVVLSADRISVSANATNKLLHDVPYDEVISISYSRGIDPPTAGSAGGVRGTVGVLRPVGVNLRRGPGALPGRDWVTLRTTKAKSEVIVLRFDGEADARRAVAAIEERLATPPRETRESTR